MINSTRKIFFWFVALVLVIACAPSVATPVPPLDPNAINTYIVQTADAASAQTQDALPPTLTFTPTLRSTFTPESTFTNVPSIIFPTSTPIQRKQYFRVKHDNQLARYNYKSRTAENWNGFDEFTPEVVPLFVGPNKSYGTLRTKVDGSWEIYIDALNDNDKKKLRYLKLDNSGLFNGSGFPNLESLTMGGNVITLAEIQSGMGRVNTINYKSPGALKDVNYITRPDLVHKFVVVAWNKKAKTTYWVDTPKGPIFWPLVASADVWISLDRVEPFPTLPRVVTANTTQMIRRTPAKDGTETGTELVEGEFIRIVEYYPSGPDVWGRVSGGGWIALLLNKEFLTDWKMETVPPP
ncbi:MAG TPA: hypothetical protein VLA72_23725 [Anaerolineales bacterium]|nr:hypothetical protein [Anaerolineales bacterium]